MLTVAGAGSGICQLFAGGRIWHMPSVCWGQDLAYAKCLLDPRSTEFVVKNLHKVLGRCEEAKRLQPCEEAKRLQPAYQHTLASACWHTTSSTHVQPLCSLPARLPHALVTQFDSLLLRTCLWDCMWTEVRV